jgi:hypothetical protein
MSAASRHHLFDEHSRIDAEQMVPRRLIGLVHPAGNRLFHLSLVL